MIKKCRRSRLRSSSDPLESKENHRIFTEGLMEQMLPLGQGATLMLVPISHDVFMTRRVHFEKRKNTETGKVEFFLPKKELEVVTVFKAAFFQGRKYFLVLSGKGESTRIVWLRYCTTVDSEELVVTISKNR